MKFHSKPVYDKNYIKAEVKTFKGAIHTIFEGDEIAKERVHCIAATNIDSVMKMDKIMIMIGTNPL